MANSIGSTCDSKSTASSLTAGVIVVTYCRPQYLRRCLNHLVQQSFPAAEVIVVDGSPDDSTRQVVADFPSVIYLRNERGYGHRCLSRNIGLRHCSADIVAFVDDDSYTRPDWLEHLIAPYANDPKIAGVGGRSLNGQPGEETTAIDNIGKFNPDGSLSGNFAADPGRVIEVDHVIGCNMSFRRRVLCEIGGFSIGLFKGHEHCEETDVCLRVRKAGYKIAFTPLATTEHVAAPFPKGQRFDVRYSYFASRNTILMLLKIFGPAHPVIWRYLLTTSGRSFFMMCGRIAKGIVYFVAETAGTASGIFAGLIALTTPTIPIEYTDDSRQNSTNDVAGSSTVEQV